MHTIMSPTTLNTDAGRRTPTSVLINTPHIHATNQFVDTPCVHFAKNLPVAQSPVLQQDDEDEDLMVLTFPMAGKAQTPTRRRVEVVHREVSTEATFKRVWNVTKGIFKNKKIAVCDDDDDDDSFVIVFQTPDRPARLTRPPSVQRETKNAEIHDTESVLDIVHPTTSDCPTWLTSLPPPPLRQTKVDDAQEETRKEYAAWIQTRNAAGNVCRTPDRPNRLTSPPLVRRMSKKVELGAAMDEMRKVTRVVTKKLQTIY